jgi:hypothetical protein
MQLLSQKDLRTAPMRGALYGDPKSGKTPLALQLPLGPDKPLGEALYVAADEGSWRLTACPAEQRQFIHVVRPLAEPGTPYDPAAEAWNIAMTDWSDKENWPEDEDWSNVRTMIWDTMSETSIEILNDIADRGQFSKEGHVTIGGAKNKGKFNLPIMGDFNGAQSAIERITKRLFKQPLNLICIYHTDIDAKDDDKILVGGPATVGKATIRKVAKPFDWVLRIEKKGKFNSETKKMEQETIVHTDASGVWIGGVRIAGQNMMPSVTIKPDTPFAKFWPKFFEAFPEVSIDSVKASR